MKNRSVLALLLGKTNSRGVRRSLIPSPRSFALFLFLLFAPSLTSAQTPWSNFLNYVPAGSKGVAQTGIDWSNTQTGLTTSNGLPPDASWTQAGSTIAASACGNGSTDCTSTIQTALNSCGTDQYVLLGPGIFLLNSSNKVMVPSNCVLRGSGANQTTGTVVEIPSNLEDGTVVLGTGNDPNASNDVTITSGATAQSTSIVVSNASNIGVGTLLIITEFNETAPNYSQPGGGASASPSYVVPNADWAADPSDDSGQCSYCDGLWNGTRNRSQIVEVTSVSGSTIGLHPPLYTDYTETPHATPYNAGTNSGIENIYWEEGMGPGGTSTHTSRNSPVIFYSCKYCWITGNYFYFMDGDYVKFYWAFRDLLWGNLMDDGDNHGPGSDNQAVTVTFKSSANQVVNNIFLRAENTVLYNFGASGNVFAYNFATGGYASPSSYASGFEAHSTHVQFNLLEGNIDATNWFDVGHGSNSQQTDFRNYWAGDSYFCGSANTKTTISCSGAAWTTNADNALRVDSLSVFTNAIGDIVGSPSLVNNNSAGALSATMYWSADFNGRNCTNRIGVMFGFTLQCDSGSSSYDTTYNAGTALLHGLRNYINTTTTWSGNLTHTLPASFFLSNKPSWWTSSLPWPGIGPDITGGTLPSASLIGEPSGMVYMNPAMNCYYNVVAGTEGGNGSPYNTFNAATCYGQSDPPPVVQAPTGLTATVN